jgi:hypothetical protein
MLNYGRPKGPTEKRRSLATASIALSTLAVIPLFVLRVSDMKILDLNAGGIQYGFFLAIATYPITTILWLIGLSLGIISFRSDRSRGFWALAVAALAFVLAIGVWCGVLMNGYP